MCTPTWRSHLMMCIFIAFCTVCLRLSYKTCSLLQVKNVSLIHRVKQRHEYICNHKDVINRCENHVTGWLRRRKEKDSTQFLDSRLA